MLLILASRLSQFFSFHWTTFLWAIEKKAKEGWGTRRKNSALNWSSNQFQVSKMKKLMKSASKQIQRVTRLSTNSTQKPVWCCTLNSRPQTNRNRISGCNYKKNLTKVWNPFQCGFDSFTSTTRVFTKIRLQTICAKNVPCKLFRHLTIV